MGQRKRNQGFSTAPQRPIKSSKGKEVESEREIASSR